MAILAVVLIKSIHLRLIVLVAVLFSMESVEYPISISFSTLTPSFVVII